MTEFTYMYPTKKIEGISIAEGISFFQFDIEYDLLFKELSTVELAIFSHFIDLFEEQHEDFFTTLNDQKKFEALVKNFAVLYKKSSISQQQDLLAKVTQFFSKIKSSELTFELSNFFDYSTYKYLQSSYFFTFEGYEQELVPFTKERLLKDKIVFQQNEETYTISPQSLMVIRVLEFRLKMRLDPLKLNCKYNEDFQDYPHIQLLLALLTNETTFVKLFMKNTAPLTSMLESVILYSQLRRFLFDISGSLEDKDFELIIENQRSITSNKFIHVLYLCYTEHLKSNAKKDKTTIQTLKKKNDENNVKLEKQKGKFNEQKTKLNELKEQLKESKQSATTTIVKDTHLEDSVKKLTAERDQLLIQIQSLTSESERKVFARDAQIDHLKNENSQLQRKLQPLLKAAAIPKVETVTDWLEIGHKIIQNVSDEDEANIKQFFEMFLIACDEKNAKRPKSELPTNLFGYCTITSNGHYLNLPNGDKHKIIAIPENIYLGEGQFVQVTKDYEFVQVYNNFFDESPIDHNIRFFCTVKFSDGKPHVNVNGILEQVTHDQNITLIDGQIISVTSQLELVRFYKQKRMTLDYFDESMKLKGHTPYFIQKLVANGAIVENVFTNEEKYIVFEQNEDGLYENSLVTAIENRMIRTFRNPLFYKLSKYYKHTQFATIYEIDGDCFAKKANREIVIIKNIPDSYEPQVDDVIIIDEHHSFLDVIDNKQTSEEETLEQRLARRPVQKSQTVFTYSTPKDLTPILIVGNIALSENYKQQLGRNGYDVTTVDGFGPIAKIKQNAKDKDFIVVCLERLSHGNMYAIKDEFPENKVIYAERDGVTQIKMKLLELSMSNSH